MKEAQTLTQTEVDTIKELFEREGIAANIDGLEWEVNYLSFFLEHRSLWILFFFPKLIVFSLWIGYSM